MITRGNKTAIALDLIISKVADKIYVILDGNLLDMYDFGISAQMFHNLAQEIEKSVVDIIGSKSIPESQL